MVAEDDTRVIRHRRHGERERVHVLGHDDSLFGCRGSKHLGVAGTSKIVARNHGLGVDPHRDEFVREPTRIVLVEEQADLMHS